MFCRSRSNGCADSDAAAHRYSHDCTHADLSAHCAPCGCNCAVAGADRHILACTDGNLAAHVHSHVRADAHAGTNPGCCEACG